MLSLFFQRTQHFGALHAGLVCAPSRSGIASGTLNTARQTGSVIGVALFGSLIAGGRPGGGLHVALVIAAGLSLLVAVLDARTPVPQT